MRLALRSVLAALAIGCFSLKAEAVDIYVLSNDDPFPGSPSTNFGRIDSVTGSYASIASLTGDVYNATWNPAAGNFYVTAGGSSSTNLRTLTTSGALSAPIGTIGVTIYAMAYRTANDTLYAYNYAIDQAGKIDTSNGSWSAVNTNPDVSTFSPVGGRYSIMNDTMYFAGNFSGLHQPGIGRMGYTALSGYQQIAANALYTNMVLANDGTTMYGIFGNGSPGQQRLYSIDVATGAFTAGPFITGAGLGTFFHGASTTVPEPSTYALAAIATVVLAGLARRRRALGA